MSLGVAIFASVVLVLAVYHKGFRKVVLWTGGVAVALALLAAACYFGHDRYSTWQADREAQKQKVVIAEGVMAYAEARYTDAEGRNHADFSS
jgi:hypothetical protein